jgi:transposase
VSSQFKCPPAVRPEFLHSPRRVDALMFLMVVALMLHHLIQHIHRASLPDDAPRLKNPVQASELQRARGCGS